MPEAATETAAPVENATLSPQGVAAPPSEPPPPAGDVKPDDKPAEKPPLQPNPRTKEFAALTRKEREVRARIAEMQDIQGKADAFTKAQKLAKENPEEYLRLAGLTYDEVTKYYVNGQKPDPHAKISATEERIARLETALAEKDRAIEAEKTNRAIAEFVAKIDTVVQSSPDFELIREEGAVDQVYQLIDLHYQKHGELLDISVAAKQIEAVLEEKAVEKAKRLLATNKVKSRLGIQEPAPEGAKKSSTSPTVTGKTNTEEPSAKPARPETLEQRWQRIMARARAE